MSVLYECAMKPIPSIHRLLTGLLLLALGACGHDAKRDNPLDPQLTPPVELSVALDDTAGIAMLSWTPYEGEAPFAAYWMLRRPLRLVDIDTLLAIDDVNQTTFLDSAPSPNTAYQYRVSVVNSSGYEATSAETSVPGYEISPVTLLGMEIDGQSGAAGVRWTRYAGARFEAYRVERQRAGEDDFAVVARVQAVSDTSFTDADLLPDVTYAYRIVVEAAGRDWTSNRSGREDSSLESVRLLIAQPDGTEGVVRVVWSGFRGPGFEAYDVRRRAVGTDDLMVLEQITTRTDTSFVDENPLADVAYEYSVAVRASDQHLVSNGLERQLTLPAVLLSEPKFDSETASASLTWTEYTGPRFSSYQLRRRTAGQEYELVVEVGDIAATSYTDSSLHGNTEYFYQIRVETERGEPILGEEIVATSFHQPVASWPLELDEEAFVRLYREEENRLTVLVSSPERVRLLFFDTQGTLLEEQVLMEHPLVAITPRSVATARLKDGERYLSLATEQAVIELPAEFDNPQRRAAFQPIRSPLFNTYVLRFSAEGQPLRRRRQLFVDDLPTIAESEGEIGDAIGFILNDTGPGGGLLAVDNVEVFRGESLLHSLIFDDGFELTPSVNSVAVVNGWELVAARSTFTDRTFFNFVVDKSWQDIRLESDIVALNDVLITFLLGHPLLREQRIHLMLDFLADKATLEWREGVDDVVAEFSEDVELRDGLIYRVGLEEVEGQISAWIDDPMFWRGDGVRWSSLTALQSTIEKLLLTAAEQPLAINLEGKEATGATPLPDAASELRVWEIESGQWVGVCLPLTNEIRLVQPGALFQVLPEWPEETAIRVGSAFGQGDGQLILPLSFDVAADGRIYILDAGNARIQVFDLEGNYITQWGGAGVGVGEFDFGIGGSFEDFVGSIVVGDDGFIYVADVGNPADSEIRSLMRSTLISPSASLRLAAMTPNAIIHSIPD